MTKSVFKIFLVGRKGCTHSTNDSSDTTYHAPKSDPFDEDTPWGRQPFCPPFLLTPVFSTFFSFLCLSSPTFPSNSSEPDHSIVPECGPFMSPSTQCTQCNRR